MEKCNDEGEWLAAMTAAVLGEPTLPIIQNRLTYSRAIKYSSIAASVKGIVASGQCAAHPASAARISIDWIVKDAQPGSTEQRSPKEPIETALANPLQPYGSIPETVHFARASFVRRIRSETSFTRSIWTNIGAAAEFPRLNITAALAICGET